jgi:hypothetical protein
MTRSMQASLTAIGRQLNEDYQPTLAKPLPTELKDLVARLIALEINKRGSSRRAIAVLQARAAQPEDQRDGAIVMGRAIALLSRPASDVILITAGMAAAVEVCRRWTKGWSDGYRPELHYMRGPGPKWREKHGHADPHRSMSPR